MSSFYGAMAVCPICEKPYFMDQPWKRVCLACYLEHKKTTTQPVMLVAQPIEPGMLRRLVQLCHPDRHGGSEASHVATQWLLGMRGSQ
jgi:hypothetical protein